MNADGRNDLARGPGVFVRLLTFVFAILVAACGIPEEGANAPSPATSAIERG